MPPVSQVTDIRTLQELDEEAATLHASLDDVERRLRGSEALDQARAAFASLDAELIDLRRRQRALDGDISVLNARIQPEEKRLYDGSVRNPKELSNIQHELELLKAQRSKLEDQLLEVMSCIESVEAAHAAARQQLARAEQQRELDLAELQLEAKRLGDALVRVDARREAQKLKISPQALRVYESIRRRHGSMAVAHIQAGMCAGCRVTIPEAIRRRAFQPDQLAQCPNCERILFVG
jgi:predicted  nucleic acid-binding Zn-ribbon protein